MYTLIAVVDPLTLSGAQMFSQISLLRQQQYPIRFGVVLSCTSVRHGNFVATVDVCRLFASIRESYSSQKALSFLSDVAEVVIELFEKSGEDKPAPLTLETLSKSFSRFAKKGADAKSILNTPKLHMDFVLNSTQYLLLRGLPENSFSLNGIVFLQADISSILMQVLGREQYILSQYVAMGFISDSTKSLFSEILSLGGAYTRYHKLLEEKVPRYLEIGKNEKYLDYFDSLNFTYNEWRAADFFIANTTILIVPPSKIGLDSISNVLNWMLRDAKEIGKHGLAIELNFPTLSEQYCNWLEPCNSISESTIFISRFMILSKFLKLTASLNCHTIHVVQTVVSTLINEKLDWETANLIEIVVNRVNIEFPGCLIDVEETIQSIRSESFDEFVDSKSRIKTLLTDILGNLADEDIVIVYNARKIQVTALLQEADMSLISTIEHGRIGLNIEQAFLTHTAELTNVTVQPKSLLRIYSFAGNYGYLPGNVNPDGSQTARKRFDFENALLSAIQDFNSNNPIHSCILRLNAIEQGSNSIDTPVPTIVHVCV